MHPPVEELSAFVRAELGPLTAVVARVVDDRARAAAIARRALATVCAQSRSFSHDRPELCARRVALRAAVRRARRERAVRPTRATAPARTRAAWALAREGRSPDEIADVLECTPATVRRALRRAPARDDDGEPAPPPPPTAGYARSLVEGGLRAGRLRAAASVALAAATVVAAASVEVPESWRVGRESDPPPRRGVPVPAGVVDVRVGYGPRAVVAAFGSVWVVSQWVRPGVVTRIDPVANEVAVAIPVGGEPQAAAAGYGALWVAVRRGPSVVRIDPRTERITARVELASPPLSVAAARGSVWVGTETEVVRVDPRSGRVVARAPASFAAALAVVGDEVWVANLSGATITRLDAGTGRLVGTTRVRALGAAMLSAYGDVWVARGHDVLRLDPASARPVGKVDLGAPAGGLAASDGAVWVASANRAVHVDAATGAIVEELPAGSGAQFGIALVDGDVWIANHNSASVWRIDPNA
ncbi:MAG TPA: hypothetical protein VHJ34_06225 [Actinomycetota bacterium]|nr:hypothetical protein [Actinomycetota bacterium]